MAVHSHRPDWPRLGGGRRWIIAPGGGRSDQCDPQKLRLEHRRRLSRCGRRLCSGPCNCIALCNIIYALMSARGILMKARESSAEAMQRSWRSGSREAIVAAAEQLFLGRGFG